MGKPKLETLKRPVNDHVVEALEIALEDAKAGEVNGVVVSGTNARGETYYARAGYIRTFSQTGAMLSAILVTLIENDELVREKIREVMS